MVDAFIDGVYAIISIIVVMAAMKIFMVYVEHKVKHVHVQNIVVFIPIVVYVILTFVMKVTKTDKQIFDNVE
jgi:transcriptional regulator of met regulon